MIAIEDFKSVEIDGLPESQQQVIVYTKDNKYVIADYAYDRFIDYRGRCINDVMYWCEVDMPDKARLIHSHRKWAEQYA